MSNNHNSAKFAFFYVLSLVALIFVAISTGNIIFQLVNKYIVDIVNQYSGAYTNEAIKFSISALIVATPIYFIVTRYIYKSLYKGELNKDAGVRRWLSYLILLVTVIVILGVLIATINSLLDGELTTKFILKALTAVIISGIIFSFYLYDMKREKVQGVKDKILQIYFWLGLIIIIGVFITSLFIVESPNEARNRKIDGQVVQNFQEIDNALDDYYYNNAELPESLYILQGEYGYLSDADLRHPETREVYGYNIVSDRKYELCSDFLTVSKEDDSKYGVVYNNWEHEAGYQCVKNMVPARINQNSDRVDLHD